MRSAVFGALTTVCNAETFAGATFCLPDVVRLLLERNLFQNIPHLRVQFIKQTLRKPAYADTKQEHTEL